MRDGAFMALQLTSGGENSSTLFWSNFLWSGWECSTDRHSPHERDLQRKASKTTQDLTMKTDHPLHHLQHDCVSHHDLTRDTLQVWVLNQPHSLATSVEALILVSALAHDVLGYPSCARDMFCIWSFLGCFLGSASSFQSFHWSRQASRAQLDSFLTIQDTAGVCGSLKTSSCLGC